MTRNRTADLSTIRSCQQVTWLLVIVASVLRLEVHSAFVFSAPVAVPRQSAACRAASYLESSGTDPSTNSPDQKDYIEALKKKQAQLQNEKLNERKNAFLDASIRTSLKKTVKARFEREQRQRKKKERASLERLYVECKERLDAKKKNEQRHSEEREKEKGILAQKAAGPESKDDHGPRNKLLQDTGAKRGIPIFERPSFLPSPPLIIGNALTYRDDDLTPFQKRGLEIAQWFHEEHMERMKIADAGPGSLSKAGDEGGIEALPFIAVIDSYSEKASEDSSKRYATLASIDKQPSTVTLTGVGRVMLHSYFTSEDAGLSKDEGELSKLLARIQEFEQETLEKDETEPSVLMAEFEIHLDAQQRTSSRHAIAALYRAANRVYRLHEERQKLVAGLRAGDARLQLGKLRIEGECILFGDYDGLGLNGGGVSVLGELDDEENCSLPLGIVIDPSLNIDALENYSFGSYGTLSTVPDLTQELMTLLEPFYSPLHRAREEYEAEVSSFVILRILERYAEPLEIAEALLTPSATRRLDMSFEMMTRHRDELNRYVKVMSDELIQCGEECTDLW